MSKAKKLKKVKFRFVLRNYERSFEQLVEVLGTITGDHEAFERVTIHLTIKSRAGCGTKEIFCGRFRAIDSALVQLRERKSSPFFVKFVLVGRLHFNIELGHLLPKVMENRDVRVDLGDIGLFDDD